MCLAQGPQRSDAGEARTHDPSVSSKTLYHWATALPQVLLYHLFENNVISSAGFNRSQLINRSFQSTPWVSEGLPWLRIYCSQHSSQMESVRANGIDFSQGFSQKLVSRSCSVFNSLPASGDLPSADDQCKQFWPRSGPTKCWAWSGSNLFDTLMVLKKIQHPKSSIWHNNKV